MKLIISCVFSLFTLTSLFSQEISGSWQGILEIQGTNLEIVFHIEKQANNFVSTMDSPTQGAFGIATTKTSFDNDKLQIIVSNLGIFYQATLKSDSLFGTFNQNGMPFPLTLVRTEKKTQLRPQEPKEPYPYKVEEVVFTNLKEKIDLSATLTLPKE
ncbi:MAG: alpha/beta hydrolase, partial [Dysgonamonadaceae bacterium]